MTVLTMTRANGLLSVQDLGRPGHMAEGLSRGGAMDRRAVLEAAALLGARQPLAGIEMAGAGGTFTVDAPTRIALTGAPMTATLDGAPLRWNATHRVDPGQQLAIGGAQAGVYGTLTPAGGIATPEWLGSRAAHLTIGIGALLQAGVSLPCGDDPDPDRPARTLTPADRFGGGPLRIMDGPQTALFDEEVITAFLSTRFTRGARGNRQGVQLDAGRRFTTERAAGLASDMIQPGDVQMTGDGVPYVLMAECQTVGGYPRIGTILPADLPRVAQAAPGAALSFRRVTGDEARAAWQDEGVLLQELAAGCTNLIRDPRTMPDLLAHQLIGGVTRGDELEEER